MMNSTTVTDTIIVFVRDSISQSELIEAYQTSIETQSSNYQLLISAFLGILAMVGFGTWFYSVKVARIQIKKHTKRIFKQERSSIISSIKEEYDGKFRKIREEYRKELIKITATSSRIFAITIDIGDEAAYTNKISWWMDATEKYIITDSGYYTTISVDEIVRLTSKLESDSALKKAYISQCKNYLRQGLLYNYEYYNSIIEMIPNTLTDQRIKLKSFFDSIKDEISLESTENELKKKE